MVVAALPDDRFRIVATIDEAVNSVAGIHARTARSSRAVGEARLYSRRRLELAFPRPSPGGADAAHVHSPAGGQVMNTGIQDAASLAEVLTGGGDDAGVDAWAAERHRVASEIVAFTDRMTRMATINSGTGQTLRNAAISIAGHLPLLQAKLATKIAELDND